MQRVKSKLKSKTVWSNIVTIVALVLPLAGLAELVPVSTEIINILQKIVAGISALTGIYYRVQATHELY